MDNSFSIGRERVCFGPDRRMTVLEAALGAGAGYLAFAWPSAPGRLLFALAAAMLVGYALADLVFSPRLCATRDGVAVNAPLARAQLSWAQIDTVRADAFTRHGVRSTTLHVDAGDRLIVLSRRALGATPEAVAERVNALDPRQADASRDDGSPP